MKRVVVSSLLLCSLFFSVVAQQAPPAPDDPELDKRVFNLSQELRCLVCQNETLADSQADLAGDLRNQIREQALWCGRGAGQCHAERRAARHNDRPLGSERPGRCEPDADRWSATAKRSAASISESWHKDDSGLRNSCDTAATKSDCKRATAISRLTARTIR